MSGVVLVASALAVVPATAATYHVAQTVGADTNDGSAATPFASIGACARIALPGDTCTVHAGTYRETVSPARSGTAAQPIRFVVADGECAIVSGTEPITASFTRGTGDIWQAPVSDDIQQLFSKGKMIWEAQWPNRTPGALFDDPKAVAGPGTGVFASDGGSVTRLVDANIPSGDWTGASVYIFPGARWQSDSRPVLAYDQSMHTVILDTTVPWAEKSIQPIPGNHYYLYGSPLALDAQDEWLLERGTLSYYSVDDPAGHGLEYKHRLYAFDVAASYVHVVGFRVFGAAVRLRGNSNVVDSLAIEYSSHLRSFNAYHTLGDVNTIAGDDNTWKNSLIDKSGSAGLVIAGSRNLIQNNVVRDVVYQATNHAGIDAPDWRAQLYDNQILYNTVARSGRAGIFLYGCRRCRALYNRVSHWALLTNDMGGIYAWGTDGWGTEIAYNDVGGSTAFWSNGIYLDDGTKHFVVHHNVVHDSTFFGFCIKQENHFFDNTLVNVGTPFLIGRDNQTGQWASTNRALLTNNLADATLLVRVGVLPSAVTDFGYWEGEVHATPDWKHVELPFSSLYQPAWYVATPLDLTAIKQLAFTPLTNGDFELDVDNIQLTGASPKTLDDFEAGGANALGGYSWGGGAGDGVGATSGALTVITGAGPAGTTRFAHFAGTLVQGDDTWGLMTESLPDSDLSAYTGIAFDIRGRRVGLKVLATGENSPMQDHNDSCAFAGTAVPECAVDRGTSIAGITDPATGAGPDLGAFEAGQTPWVPGARRNDEASCGKIADVTDTVPPPYPTPWADGGEVTDAGAGDTSPDVTDAPPASDAAVDESSTTDSRGCGCNSGGSSSGGASLLLLLGLALTRMGRSSMRP